MDLFLPNNRFASADRGRAFLWLLYHYLEDCEGINPFEDLHARANPGKIPFLRQLTLAEHRRENVDLPEEIQWGNKMSNLRNIFLQKLVAANEGDKKTRAIAPHFVTGNYIVVLMLSHRHDLHKWLFYQHLAVIFRGHSVSCKKTPKTRRLFSFTYLVKSLSLPNALSKYLYASRTSDYIRLPHNLFCRHKHTPYD